MENSTIRRGLVVLVLATCTMLGLWWLADHLKGDAEPTPSATLTAVS
ncbi:MAG: hypothetical protein NVV57_06375 [Demequina sp.]|jgi:hypothetical protein|nr:hypothetical protein [Demequina sp.]